MGTSLRRYDFWDRLDVRALLMTTACHTKTIPEITAPKSWPILSRDSEAGKDGKETYKLDCKTVFPLKTGLRAFSPQSRSPFSASLQTFCLTIHAHLNTQKYGSFCNLRARVMHLQSYWWNSGVFIHCMQWWREGRHEIIKAVQSLPAVQFLQLKVHVWLQGTSPWTLYFSVHQLGC